MRRKRRRGRARNAQQKDAPIKQRREEYVGVTEQRTVLRLAAMKDVPTMFRREEFVASMVQSKPVKLAAKKDVPIKSRKEECVEDMVHEEKSCIRERLFIINNTMHNVIHCWIKFCISLHIDRKSIFFHYFLINNCQAEVCSRFSK